MKITFILLFCSLVNLIASPTYSQNTNMSLSLNNATVEEVVNKNELPQQLKKITGTVTDSKGEAIIGANVIVSSTTIGTITDISGKYTIEVPRESKSLTFSFIGMQPQDVNIGTLTEINVILEESLTGLDEVVVVGYGTQRKSDLTGSIVSVKSDQIKDMPVSSVTEALQGKVAGVFINKSSGLPGSTSEIIIRGVGSINGLNPLYIVDGVPRGNTSTFNPKDVESIEIIKDASAAAIYGSQAAGGVILITTKRGSYNTKATYEFSSNTGVRSVSKRYNFLETPDHIRARQLQGDNYALWNDPASLPNTDWIDQVLQNGLDQSYILSARGGTENINYYMSGGYEREDGITKSSFWERYSMRINADYKISNKLTFGHQLYMAKVNQRPYTGNLPLPWRTLPYMAVYNAAGTFQKVPAEVEFSGSNPVADLAYYHYKQNQLLFQGSLFADYEIIKGLNLRVTGSGDFGSGFTDAFNETNMLLRTSVPNSATYSKTSSYGEGYVLTSLLTYAKTFGGVHDLKVMAGYEINKSFSSGLNATANTFPVEPVESFALSSNPQKIAGGSLVYGAGLSQFGRLNYSYSNRYLLTANIRRDGSPKFGPENRWGVFPSVSAGWKINEEAFFKNLNLGFIDVLKPRISWGILGNDAAIASFAYQPSFTQLTLHSFDASSTVGGFNNVKVINPAIKWEEIHSTNAGLDISMFKNKITVAAEYYSRQTKDMLYNLPIPHSTGIGPMNSVPSTMPVNIGQISNKGWELSVSYTNNVGDFSYSLSGNLSHNVNQVVNLGLTNAFIYSGGLDFMSGNSPFKTVNGQPVGQIYGLITDGLIKDQAEMDALNANATERGLALGTVLPGKVAYYNNINTGPGDWKFKDQNGDGRVTDLDRTFLGNPWPKYQYGFELQLGWKGIELSAQGVGIAGREVINGSKAFEENFQQDFQSTYKIFGASFLGDNGLTDQPRTGKWTSATAFLKDPSNNYRWYSDYFVENGSYLKIKNISLGYNLPENLLNRVNIKKLKIYLSGQNLITLTKFTGLDPEFSNDVKSHGLYGIKTYPQTKTYSIGLEMGF